MARLVTQLYSKRMGGEVEPSQFVLLSVLAHKPGWAQAQFAQALGYDKTTLSRSLLLMRKNGWITAAFSEDARERGYTLTAKGASTLRAATPRWQRAQDEVRGAMTAEEWTTVGNAFAIFARVARKSTLS